jgi:hypothetical protein
MKPVVINTIAAVGVGAAVLGGSLAYGNAAPGDRTRPKLDNPKQCPDGGWVTIAASSHDKNEAKRAPELQWAALGTLAGAGVAFARHHVGTAGILLAAAAGLALGGSFIGEPALPEYQRPVPGQPLRPYA